MEVPSPVAVPGIDRFLTYLGWGLYTAGLFVMLGVICGVIWMIVGAFRRGAFEGGKLIVVSFASGAIISGSALLLGQFLQGVPTITPEQPPWLEAVNTIIGWALFLGGIAALGAVVAGAVWLIVGAVRHGVYEGMKAIMIALFGAGMLGTMGTWFGTVMAF
ncbi:hypothetical protein [Yimella sp. cx-51]|uniref:hypothetical protein n=1 Tax=Yimella sp. cx-51 TaxID=2770551 RepID=UPI00165E456E|nr:hypothetical protein [Yimella sp. cx-51]MBC9958352.1 hypothetical protein [Yimella sp. cx-51]QTH39734.1 hypothetical protein J5M86_15265 [Yimella sp. cx-51]